MSRHAIGLTLISLYFVVGSFLVAASLGLLTVPRFVLLLGIALVTVFYAAGVEMLPSRQERAVRTANHLMGLVASLVICGAIIGMTIGTPLPSMRSFLVVLGVISGGMAILSSVFLLSVLSSSDDSNEN